MPPPPGDGPASQRLDTPLAITWALCLASLLTTASSTPFVFLEPLSFDFRATVALFLLTSAGLLPVRGARALVLAHLVVVAWIAFAHPLSSVFGRDGAFVVTAVHFLVALRRRAHARAEVVLLASSAVVSLLIAEAVLAKMQRPAKVVGLQDYGDVIGPYHAFGFLRPQLRARVIGEHGAADFITDSHGFRSDHEVSLAKPSGAFRVLLVGDSFVTGYRTDQRDFIGVRLEAELRRSLPGRNVEVVVAGAGYPGAARDLFAQHGFPAFPDLLVLGVTIGNDISQSWTGRHALPSDVLGSVLLPPDAFRSPAASAGVRLERTARAWRTVRQVEDLAVPETIRPWYDEWPGHVHLFDPAHSLGHFFARRTLPVVEQSYADLFADLAAIDAQARGAGVPAVFAFFPQRFQVDEREWPVTLRRFGLDPAAFDPELPNRRLMAWCAAGGRDCLDLLEAFRAGCRGKPCYLAGGDMHWNGAGHAVAARAIASYAGPHPDNISR